MTTDKSSEREAFVYWWRHKYSAADLEGIPEHVALNAAWAAWQARAALPQQAQDIAEASGGAEGGPEEDRIEAAFWRFDARHKGYGQWRQAPMSERDAFKAEMRNALHAEAVRAEMRMVVKGWRKQGPQQAQETSPTEVHSCSYFCDRPACIKAQRDELRDRATSLPPQGAEPDACRRCNGEGTVRSHTTHLGPDDYDFDEQCPQCAGTGSADLKDAINALGFWTHKTDIQRTLIERSAVLRILEARAALAASPAPAPQEPLAWVTKGLTDPVSNEFRHRTEHHRVGWPVPLYASPAPGELGAVDAAAGWISVDDRMPEPDSGEVLVWLSGGRCAFDEWHMHREDPTGMSTTYTMEMGLMWRDYEFEDITHWMSLPQPPQQAPSESSAQGSGGAQG